MLKYSEQQNEAGNSPPSKAGGGAGGGGSGSGVPQVTDFSGMFQKEGDGTSSKPQLLSPSKASKGNHLVTPKSGNFLFCNIYFLKHFSTKKFPQKTTMKQLMKKL